MSYYCVVNVNWLWTMTGYPSVSVMPPDGMVTVYKVPTAKPAAGIKVTAMLLTEQVPATAGEKLNDVEVTDTALILLLKVTTTAEATGTAVAPLAGVVQRFFRI